MSFAHSRTDNYAEIIVTYLSSGSDVWSSLTSSAREFLDSHSREDVKLLESGTVQTPDKFWSYQKLYSTLLQEN